MLKFKAKQLLKLILAMRLRKKRNKRIRKYYIRSIFVNRNNHGELSLVRELSEDPYYHHWYFRMTSETFRELLDLVSNEIDHGHNHMRPISTLERLAITLRYLATGNSQVSLAMNYRISTSSVNIILREVMAALCNVLSKYLIVPTSEGWEKIAEGFEKKWNFPMCCGAIDGKHVRIKAPPGSGSQYFNYKGFFSIVLLAIVDANCKFTLIDVGSSGSCSDGGILKKSVMGKKLEENKYDFPHHQLAANGEILRNVIIGDDGFPLKPYLLKPYSGRYVDRDEAIFNYRLSRARMVAENSFGLLAARWRIFLSTIDALPDLATLIVKTCVLLHNFLLDKNDTCGITLDRSNNGEVMPGNWRIDFDGNTLAPIGRQGSNNATTEAFNLRNQFKTYFNSTDGAVSWQDARAFPCAD